MGRGSRKRADVNQYLAGCLLHDNLRDFIEELLARCRTEISQASMKAQETGDDAEQASVPPFWLAEDTPLAGSAHLARHAERLDRYQQLIHLRDEGFTQKEIARRLGMAQRTVWEPQWSPTLA